MAFYSAFQWDAFWNKAYQIARSGLSAPSADPNGNRWREYKPTYHEMRERRAIERKFQEAELDLKSTKIKIEELEFKRLQDLADQAMQLELLQLLAQKHQLTQFIEQLQQQKLRALQDDDDFVMLLMQFN